MSMNPDDRPVETLRGIAEPLLAVAGAFLLTSLLALPFVPVRLRVEVELRPAPGSEISVPHAQLRDEIERLGLADGAEVLLLGGASRLVLRGVSDVAEIEGPVGDLLERSGYQRRDFVSSPELDMEGLLRTQSHTLPLLLSIQAVIFLGSGLLLARGRIRKMPPDTAAPPLHAVLFGLAAGVGAVLLSVGISALLSLVGLPVEEQEWLNELYAEPGVLLRIAPWVVLVGPVAEEVFFRGYFFRFTSQRAGLPVGLLLSSAMFAVIHWNASGFLVYLGIGCVFAWVYHRTGRIVAPIVAHATLNAIVLTVSALLVEGSEFAIYIPH